MYLRYDFPGVVPRLNHVCYAVLSECFSFVSCLSCVPLGMFFVCLMPVMRSSRNVLCSVHACCLPPVRQTGRLAGGLRSYSAVGRDRHSCVLGCRVVIGLCWFTSGLRVFWRRSRRGNEGTRGTEAARQSALLRDRISFAMFSAGSTLGLRAPDCAKESSTLWTLLRGWTSGKVRFARRGWGGADSRRRHPGIRKDPPGSDKRRPHCGWPGGSGCILLTFLALRGSKWNRHSRRAARRQRRGVGLQRAKRSACRLSLPTLRDCKIKVT